MACATPPALAPAAPAGGSAAAGVPWGLSSPGAMFPSVGGARCLSTSDIDGAQPKRHTAERHTTTPQPADPGMSPTRATRVRHVPHVDPLCVDDIPGTRGGLAHMPRPRAQPLNPLEPAYQWLPVKEEVAPPPRFIRDTLDVKDIVGSRSPPAPLRGLPSTMAADDIAGTKPGWRPKLLFETPRDPMRLDLAQAAGVHPGAADRQRQLAAAAGAAAAAGVAAAPQTSRTQLTAPFGRTYSLPLERRLPLPAAQQDAACAAPASARGWAPPAVPEHGVAFTVDWQKQRAAAIRQQGEAARRARQSAEAAIAAAAAAAAARGPAAGQPAVGAAGSPACASGSGSGGLGAMMKSLRTFDRDGCGRVQVPELAAALQRSGLGLSQGEVSALAASVADAHGGVEYRPLVAKLVSRVQQQAGGVPAGGAGAAPSPAGSVPQFVAARARRLQTHVALALGQQPEATAAEAAAAAAAPGFLPWKEAPAKPFSKRMAGGGLVEPTEEFGGGGLRFADGDPKAAEAAAAWRASKSPELAWAMRRQNRPSKQSAAAAAAAGGAGSLPVTPAAKRAHGKSTAASMVCTTSTTRCPTALSMHFREEGSPLLAAERAARTAGRQDAELVQSLE